MAHQGVYALLLDFSFSTFFRGFILKKFGVQLSEGEQDNDGYHYHSAYTSQTLFFPSHPATARTSPRFGLFRTCMVAAIREAKRR